MIAESYHLFMLKKVFRIIRLIFTYAKGEALVKLFLCVVTALTLPMTLYATQGLIDSISMSVLQNRSVDGRVLAWLCVLFGAMIIMAGLPVLDSILTIQFQKTLNGRFSRELLGKFRKIDYGCYEDPQYHDILMRMGEYPQGNLLNVFNDVITVISLSITVFSLIVLFIQISPVVSLLYFFIVMVMMFFDFKSMKMMNEMFASQSFAERELEYYRKLLSDKHVLYELKVFGAISCIGNLCKKENDRVLKERLETTIRSQKYFAMSCVCVIAWVALVIFSLVQAVFHNSISLGIFVSLVGSAGTVLSTTENLSYKLSNVARKCHEIEYYYNFMKMDEVCWGNATFDDSRGGRIEFKNVYFRYGQEDYVLKNVSMMIDLGKSTALVGENGSGKSTIVKLICRLYRPESGSILLNGQDIYTYSELEYHKIINVVFQDFVRYSFTIRENVAIGSLEQLHEDKVIRSVLKDVAGFNKCADLDVPLGKIDEAGIDLSGGEWQKIAIARACMGKSRLIIMDEPTAALDPVAESRLYASFMGVMRQRGTFIISHRMASARLADIIYVIHNGQIEERGSHGNLYEKNGLYRKMYDAQSIWYEDEGGKT